MIRFDRLPKTILKFLATARCCLLIFSGHYPAHSCYLSSYCPYRRDRLVYYPRHPSLNVAVLFVYYLIPCAQRPFYTIVTHSSRLNLLCYYPPAPLAHTDARISTSQHDPLRSRLPSTHSPPFMYPMTYICVLSRCRPMSCAM